MTFNVFDLDLHRFAYLSNIFNFGDVNLNNSSTFKLITIHLGSFMFATTISIFPKSFIKIGLVVCSKNLKIA